MKNYKIFSALIVFALVLGSCEREVIGEIYDNQNGQQLLSFEKATDNLEIVIDDTGSLDIVVEVSTLSNSDRTFTVSVITDESTAIPASYNVPGSVTIPAGSYEGTFTITGEDVAGVETDALLLTLELTAPEGIAFENQRTLVNVFQICPIPTDYLIGAYDILNITQRTGPAFGRTNFKGASNADPTLVNLAVGASETTRVFNAQLLAGAAARTAVPVTLSLVCGEINIQGEYNLGFAPDGAGNVLFYVPAVVKETYDLNDDSIVFVNYIENPQNAYAATGGPSTFVLQKRP